MLVLARKKGESIMIGDNIEVRIIDITGDSVRIGVNAPKNITIHRDEIYKEIQEENKKASETSPEKLKRLLSL
jgi:carbon storage regulator